MNSIIQLFKIRELRNKVLFVLFLLVIFRIVAHIPVPGPDPQVIREFLGRLFSQNAFLGFLNIFTGGTISNFSVAMMGLGPYITSSIILQLLAVIIPSLENLQKEGETGREKINWYARLLTIPIAFFQGYAMLTIIKRTSTQMGGDVIGNPAIFQWVLMLGALVAGTIFLMWLGELITEKGIGNGISILIFAGIVSRMPASFGQNFAVALGDTAKLLNLLGLLGIGLLVTALIVFVNEGQRNVPISYARRVRGTRIFGGVETSLPIRVNSAGVIPIIFAVSFMFLPTFIGNVFSQAKTKFLATAALSVDRFFKQEINYSIIYFILVVAFTFFYTSFIFKPKEIAENLQKQGGFIPGVRPGGQTALFLSKIISRITVFGALFLGIVAVTPYIGQALTSFKNVGIGGTSLLIVVSVVLETVKQIQAQILMHRYEGY